MSKFVLLVTGVFGLGGGAGAGAGAGAGSGAGAAAGGGAGGDSAGAAGGAACARATGAANTMLAAARVLSVQEFMFVSSGSVTRWCGGGASQNEAGRIRLRPQRRGVTRKCGGNLLFFAGAARRPLSALRP